MAKQTIIESGLKHATILDGKGGGVLLNSWDAISAWRPGLGVLWIHLNLGLSDAKEWIEEEAGLDPFIVEVLLEEEDTRPRCLTYNDGMLVILRLTNPSPGADADDMSLIKIWVEKARVITIHYTPVVITRYIQRKLSVGNGPSNVSIMLEDICGGILDNVGETVSELEDLLDNIEEKIIGDCDIVVDGLQDLMNSVSEQRRQLAALRRYLSPQRDALEMITRQNHLSWLEKDSRHNIREDGHRMTRIIEDLDVLIERAIINMDELNSLRTEASQKTIYVLSVLATLFLPFTFVTGLLGINVQGIPFSEHPNGFWIVCAIFLVSALTLYLIFKKIQWL